MTYQPTERRPIQARGWAIWRKTSTAMARAGVSPNAVSVAGMIFGLFAGAAFASTALVDGPLVRVGWGLAALGIQLRLLANLLDGMVAIESGKASPVGELYNEVPDRVSDAGTLVGAGYAALSDPTLGFVAALAAVFCAYVRAMGKAAGAPNDYCGPMAKQHRMALMTGVALWHALAPADWQPIWEGRGVVAAGLAIVAVGAGLTAVRRLLRIGAVLRKGKP